MERRRVKGRWGWLIGFLLLGLIVVGFWKGLSSVSSEYPRVAVEPGANARSEDEPDH